MATTNDSTNDDAIQDATTETVLQEQSIDGSDDFQEGNYDRADDSRDVETGIEEEEELSSLDEADKPAVTTAVVTTSQDLTANTETTNGVESFSSTTAPIELPTATQVDSSAATALMGELMIGEVIPVRAGRMRLACAIVSLVLAAAVGIALGVTLTGGGGGGDGVPIDRVPNTVAPTPTPTASPTAFSIGVFTDSLPAYTRTALQDPDSSQSQAVAWLESDEYSLNDADTVSRIQRFALATFYYATGGGTGNWPLDNGWLSARQECEWRLGSATLTCPEFPFYSILFRGDTGLTGTLPNELALLDRLQFLQVEDNVDLTGTIPTVYGDLSTLTELNLSGSAFTGALPSELGRCEQLGSFRVSDNSFRGAIPLELVWETALIYEAANNLLTGAIPNDFGTMTLLNTLDLRGNTFESTIPTSFGLLTALGVLFLDNNALAGPVPSDLGNLAALRELTLQGNSALTGSVPVEICDLIVTNGLQVTVDCAVLECDCGCQCA